MHSEKTVTHQSGAMSSHYSPFNFHNPFEGTKLTCQRFKAGNEKYEHSGTVYSEANWMRAYEAKDVNFFRDRAGHAMEHLVMEMRGQDDPVPGGNLGAVGWWVEVMAYVRANDLTFYRHIQGLPGSGFIEGLDRHPFRVNLLDPTSDKALARVSDTGRGRSDRQVPEGDFSLFNKDIVKDNPAPQGVTHS